MFTLIVCLFIASLFPLLSKIPVIYAISKAGRYDNNHPRAQQANLVGFGARAVAAHQNSFESLIVFSTAVLTALATNHLSTTVQFLAVAYVASRIVYHAMYLLNQASLRSLVWLVGLFCSLTILAICIP